MRRVTCVRSRRVGRSVGAALRFPFLAGRAAVAAGRWRVSRAHAAEPFDPATGPGAVELGRDGERTPLFVYRGTFRYIFIYQFSFEKK